MSDEQRELELCCKYNIAVQDNPIRDGKQLQCDGCGKWLVYVEGKGWKEK